MFVLLWVTSALCFAAFLCYFLFHAFKPYIKVSVNCWFCNENSRVPYPSRKSFKCSKCGQYNGFTEDGDYDRVIPEQRYEYLNPHPAKKMHCDYMGTRPDLLTLSAHNGLCHQCNSQQNYIQAQINRFEPRNEKNFFNELKDFKERLYKAYPLCADCLKYTRTKFEQDKEKLGLVGQLTSSPRGITSRAVLSVDNLHSLDSFIGLDNKLSSVAITGDGSTVFPRRKRRAAHFNCGCISNSLNVFSFSASLFLFIASLVQLQNDSDIEFFDISLVVPSFFYSSLAVRHLWALTIAGLVAHFVSLRTTRARRSLPDLVACAVWAFLVCLRWSHPTKDVVLYQLGFSSILTVVAFAVTFLPRKLLHRKKPNNIIQSAFSIASTPISQCSTLSSNSASKEISRLNELSKENESWNQKRFREMSPSRELGSLLSGLSLGNSPKANEESLIRRRGPFDSMKRPLLSAPRLRLDRDSRSMVMMPLSARYLPSNAPSVMTSASQLSPVPSFTLINTICVFAILASLFVNLFMFYHLFYVNRD